MATKKDTAAKKGAAKKQKEMLTFEVNGKEYQFVNDRCNIANRGVMTMEEIIEEPATLELLVTIKSGVIREIEK